MSIKISLTSFIDFTTSVGSHRGAVPTQLRNMYQDPSRRPWDYYGPFKAALVEGFKSSDMATELASAVSEAQKREATGGRSARGQGKHYAALAEGASDFFRRIGKITVLDAPSGLWEHGELTVRVNPPLAVARQTGEREIWYLYLKDRSLTQGGADASLMIMREALLESETSHVVPRVINVRTGSSFTLRKGRNLAGLRAYAISEAESFMRLWNASEAA